MYLIKIVVKNKILWQMEHKKLQYHGPVQLQSPGLAILVVVVLVDIWMRKSHRFCLMHARVPIVHFSSLLLNKMCP